MQGTMQADSLKMISKIYRKTQMYLNEKVKPLGITCGQVPFIMITCENGAMVQNRFCDILDMDKSSVAKMLLKLEGQGFVIRRTNSSDSRAVDVCPTEKALEMYGTLKGISDGWAAEATRGMTQIESAVFFDLLQKVTGNVAEHFG